MKKLALASIALIAAAITAQASEPAITGKYLEVRSCDVFTGPCFANGEMGLNGKEAMLVWSVDKGAWNNVPLDGLNVIAVVKVDGTLGDVKYEPRSGNAVIVTEKKATPEQQKALAAMAKEMAGGLIAKVIDTRAEDIDASLGTCTKGGCAAVKAGDVVNITTRCLGDKDHHCGNDTTFYPPLTKVDGAYPAVASLASFHGKEFNCTWDNVDQRSAFLGTFSR